MSDLVAFLRARLDEDEVSARLQDEHQSGLTHPFDPRNPCDPTRVTADVAAKRAVIDLHPHYWYTDEEPGFGMWLPECGCHRDGLTGGHGWCPTLLALAQPFAAHSDFDPAWRIS